MTTRTDRSRADARPALRAAARVALLGGLLLCAVGAILWALWPGLIRADDPGPQVAETSEPPTTRSTPTHRPTPTRPPRVWPQGRPTLLTIPDLNVRAQVVGITMADQVLTPPADPLVVGWWQDGAQPGSEEGAALITGHTVHTGGGALDELEDAQPGDRIRVVTDRGPIVYLTQSVRIYRKASLAQDAARIFAQDRPGRLVVVTCEDWDGTTYLSNVVVVAKPAP